ncbi:hypothetical protein BJ138DRAFT_567702 [Hygrophoropsis aurantiaca]|uniref:Uncharacterized protein n=1 Tax=Hygrophoropsis aurantiaca TaxID=72124 RepID=A0ACB8A1J9_9AGAM|nr:hypothetical protein BJ138DRAFT_567702 [Hygrophoropsis aurantiaca]
MEQRVRCMTLYTRKTKMGEDVVPILPTNSSFRYKSPDGVRFNISRKQLPILPAYAFTDFKVQGKTFVKVILDINKMNFQDSKN